MDDARALRRHLYEQYGRLRRRDLRARRRLRRQIAMLSSPALPYAGPDDGGPTGVREPRRPLPPSAGPGRERTRPA